MNNVYEVSAPRPLTHIAIGERPCSKCGGPISKGEKFRQYRERALTSHEACHAGTLYPLRRECAKCAGHAV